jgi:hypothetical protein
MVAYDGRLNIKVNIVFTRNSVGGLYSRDGEFKGLVDSEV